MSTSLIAEDRPVVLVHGLGRGWRSMAPLAWRLRRRGFRTWCIGYPSTGGGWAASVAAVEEELAEMGPVDLVGHSLGGLISAHLLRKAPGLQIGRVVQIGAPNLGSPLADRAGRIAFFRRACGPMVTELNQIARYQPPDPRIAAIGGTLGLPGLALKRPHDGAVSLRSAWAGAGHREAVSVVHSLLPVSHRVAKLAAEFLATGWMGSRR